MWCQADATGLSGVYLHICFPFVSFDELFTARWNDSRDHWWLLSRVDGCLFLFFVIIPFFPWFSIKFPPHHFPSDNRHVNKKENHFSIASGTFPLHRGKAVSFVAVMITVYEGGEKKGRGERRDQMEKYRGHKYAGPPPHTPPTHRTNEPKHTHSSWPIKRLEWDK